MSAWKWGLGMLGTCLGGMPGGLFGIAIGTLIDKKKEEKKRIEAGGGEWKKKAEELNLKDNDIALFVLIAAIMKADGEIRRSELDAVKRFIANNYSEDEGKNLLLLLREMVKPQVTVDIAKACQTIKDNTDYTTRYHMTDFLLRLTVADNVFTVEEHNAINSIARGLNITRADFLSMYTRHISNQYNYQQQYGNQQWSRWQQGGSWQQGSGWQQESNRQQGGGWSNTQQASVPDPYGVLGIARTASDEEVKKAYRRMAMRYHPDKVENMGEEMKKNATEQFRTINEAYETIKKERGMV